MKRMFTGMLQALVAAIRLGLLDALVTGRAAAAVKPSPDPHRARIGASAPTVQMAGTQKATPSRVAR